MLETPTYLLRHCFCGELSTTRALIMKRFLVQKLDEQYTSVVVNDITCIHLVSISEWNPARVPVPKE